MKNKPENYALLIGVQDYSRYDLSLDQPAGTTDLPGAVNDARAFYRQCISAGFSPDRIRVLTSPKLSPSDLGPAATEESVGEATREAIIEAQRWLVLSLIGDKSASGLMTFSGHGRPDDGGELCPSDLTGSLEQVISVREMFGKLGVSRGTARLTVLLDCCHAQAGESRGGSLLSKIQARGASLRDDALSRMRAKGAARGEKLVLRMQERAAKRPAPPSGAIERVVSSCQPDQTSQWSNFGGEWRGAFSWAITSVMGQWKTTERDGVLSYDLSYEELVKRATALLAALSFDQVPALTGPEGFEALPLLHPNRVAPAGSTSPEPTQDRPGGQVDGGMKDFRVYSLMLIQANDEVMPLARMVVTSAQAEGGVFHYQTGGKTHSCEMIAERETWFSDPAALSALGSGAGAGGKLRLTRLNTSGGSPDWSWSDVSETAPVSMGACSQLQTSDAACTWGATSEGFPEGSVPFGSSGSSPFFAVAITLTKDSTELAQVTWYQSGTSNVAPNGNELDACGATNAPSGYHPQGSSATTYAATSDF